MYHDDKLILVDSSNPLQEVEGITLENYHGTWDYFG